MAVLDEARKLVEDRLAEIEEEEGQLERALSKLTGTSNRPGRSSAPKAGGTTSKKSSRRRGPQTGPGRLEQVLEYFRKDPNARTKDIATDLKIMPNAVSGLKNEIKVRGLATEGPDGEILVKGSGGDDAAPVKAGPPAAPKTAKVDSSKPRSRKATPGPKRAGRKRKARGKAAAKSSAKSGRKTAGKPKAAG